MALSRRSEKDSPPIKFAPVPPDFPGHAGHIGCHPMEFKTFRRTLLIAAVLFVPAGTSMAANLYAFGGRDIAVPSILPEGNVTSRYTFTPMQLCGKPNCDLIGVSLYNKGSVWDPVDGRT